MSDVRDTVIEAVKEIEWLLQEKLGATGRGIQGKVSSVEEYLDDDVLRKIRFLGTIRNKLQHEHGFTKEDVPLKRFVSCYEEVRAALGSLDPVAGPDGAEDQEQEEHDNDDPRRAVASRARRDKSPQVVFLVAAAFVTVAAVKLCSGGSAATAQDVPRDVGPIGVTSAASTPAPFWSPAHPAQASQAFPWREEQAAFVAAGEKGTLPNETIWKVTTVARAIKRAGKTLLEMEMELAGGHAKGKVYFNTRDAFGDLKASTIIERAEVDAKVSSGSKLQGIARGVDGKSLDVAFACQREIPDGCSHWVDQGILYVALSGVSFRNALDIR